LFYPTQNFKLSNPPNPIPSLHLKAMEGRGSKSCYRNM